MSSAKRQEYFSHYMGLEEEDHAETELQRLPLEALHKDYPATTWTRIYTDGFAENVVRNGRSGVHVNFPVGSTAYKPIQTDEPSTHFRADYTHFSLLQILLRPLKGGRCPVKS